MDRQKDFPGWLKIIGEVNPLHPESFSNNILPEIFEPSMYKICISNNSEICNDLFLYIIQKYLHYRDEKLQMIFEQLRKDNFIICGPYTREVAEIKVLNIVNFANHNQQEIKCIICKDYKHVIKKS